MSTTNGTRAIVAAMSAPVIFAGALVNAEAVAKVLHSAERDVTLLCAGTVGDIAMEDVLGAGAVITALERRAGTSEVTIANDAALIARVLFDATRNDLRAALASTRGGRNVIAAGLEPDIDFAARLSVFDVVGCIENDDTNPATAPALRPFVAS